MMKSRHLLLLLTLALLATSGAGAQGKSRATRKASPQPASAAPDAAVEDYSGMYTFLKEGEFVQITIESGLLLGFISRTGDLDSDRGVYLDQFFDKGKISGNQISFKTKVLHGTWYEFEGRISRGTAKSRAQEGYWIVTGTLKEHITDAYHKVTSRSREVTFKSFPESAETGDQGPPDA
jgi:hypothetical protein